MQEGKDTAGAVEENYEVISRSGLTVYKLVNYEPSANEICLEEVSPEEALDVEEGTHLATTEDGTIIRLRAITGTSSGEDATGENGTQHVMVHQRVPVTSSSSSADQSVQFQSHGTEEATALLSLHGDAIEIDPTGQVVRKFDRKEVKLFSTYEEGGMTMEEVHSEELLEEMILHEEEDSAEAQHHREHQPRRQYIQIYTDGNEENPVQISLDHLEPSVRQSFLAAASAMGSTLVLETHPASTGGEVEEMEVLHSVQPETKEKELSTLAAFELGCEWSLALPFGFQGQAFDAQCQKLILNVWHYFKTLKKHPELLKDKNAQGLAGDALKLGTKTIGKIGKAFRRGKFYEILYPRRKTAVKRISTTPSNRVVRKALEGREPGRRATQQHRGGDGSFGSEEEDVITLADSDEESSPQAGPSTGRGRGGRGRGRGSRGGTSSPATSKSPRGGRGRGSRGARGAAAPAANAGGRKLAQTTLPVKVKNKGHSRSVQQFDDSDD